MAAEHSVDSRKLQTKMGRALSAEEESKDMIQ
jgi:hypothetical protein